VDREEIDATATRIGEAEHISWAGGRGTETGRTVFGFDTAEKAQAMQAWIDASGIPATALMSRNCLVGMGEIDKAKAAYTAGQRLAPDFLRIRRRYARVRSAGGL
jgi:hypothetical protein